MNIHIEFECTRSYAKACFALVKITDYRLPWKMDYGEFLYLKKKDEKRKISKKSLL